MQDLTLEVPGSASALQSQSNRSDPSDLVARPGAPSGRQSRHLREHVHAADRHTGPEQPGCHHDRPRADRAWGDPMAEQAVMALIQHTRRLRHLLATILVVGFSLGRRGTWFMSSHHTDLFTGAIAMAAPTGDKPPDHAIIDLRHPQPKRRVVPLSRRAARTGKVGTSSGSKPCRAGHFAMGATSSPERGGRWIAGVGNDARGDEANATAKQQIRLAPDTPQQTPKILTRRASAASSSRCGRSGSAARPRAPLRTARIEVKIDRHA